MISDLDFLTSLNEAINITPPPSKISEWIEDNRIFPQNAPQPGPFKNEVAPFMVEITDNLAVSSPIKHTILMKSVQIAATTAAENVVCWYMKIDPASVMFMSATDLSLKKWMDTRLESAIDSLDIRDLLRASTSDNKRSRKTGDTSGIKEFPGGFLLLASANSPTAMRSASIKVLLRDEIDAVPPNMSTGEGNWLDVSEERTNAYGASAKIFDFSTPETIRTSNIYRQYLKGDQRKFNVPCPHCKKLQVLEFKGTDKESGIEYGLKPCYDENGMLDHAFYVCRFCEGKIYNHHKLDMFKIESMGGTAKWIPTAASSNKTTRSYHISMLYSPVSFTDWNDVYRKYEAARGREESMKSFTNLVLGLPYKEPGQRPDHKKIARQANGSEYREGEVPEEVLFLTISVDVQTGKNSRLEIEVCGHGKEFRTASILYKVIKGDVGDAHAGAWEELYNWIISDEYKFKRKDGVTFSPSIGAIDSGDGNVTQMVYNFCGRLSNVYPVKGFEKLKNNKVDDDAFDPKGRRFGMRKVDSSLMAVNIGTNLYKTFIYGNLKRERPDFGPVPSYFCNFPSNRLDTKVNYFEMLTAEERTESGTFIAEGRRNEALDLRVYNLAMCDLYLSQLIYRAKEEAKKAGMNLDAINHDFIMNQLDVKVNTPSSSK